VLIILKGNLNLKTKTKAFVSKVTVNEKAQKASYLVVELTAQKRKSLTVGVNLIMLAFKL
jgi:hypothetical protein